MARRRTRKDPDAWVGVGIHPELHKTLKRSALEEDTPLKVHVHNLLCRTLNRPKLLIHPMEPAAANGR